MCAIIHKHVNIFYNLNDCMNEYIVQVHCVFTMDGRRIHVHVHTFIFKTNKTTQVNFNYTVHTVYQHK